MSPSAGQFHLLPQDCWEEILEYLPLDDRSRVLKTCRALRASAEPSLYRRITIDWDTPRLRTPLQLLRTFFARPELAYFVHHVAFFRQYIINCEWNEWGQLSDWPREQIVFIDVVDKTIDTIQRAQFPDADEWIQAVYEGDPHIFWTLCISKLHNLRTLRLDYSFVWQGGYPGRMVKHALLGSLPDNIMSRFEALQLVDYGGNVPLPGGWDPELGVLEETEGYPSFYNKEQFIGWFCLPALQHLAIWLRETTELQQTRQTEFNCNLGNLRTLVLARSTITEEDVLFLLSQAKSLRSLHLGLAHSLFKERKDEFVVQALDSVSDTVEKLSVGLDCYPRVSEDNLSDEYRKALYKPFLGFLKNFHRLQSAEIPITMLLGYNPSDGIDLRSVLPATLLELGLRDDLSLSYHYWVQLTIHERVQDLLPAHGEVTPFLSRIYLRICSGDYYVGHEAHEKELQFICTEAGICLDFVFDELGPGFGPYSYFEL